MLAFIACRICPHWLKDMIATDLNKLLSDYDIEALSNLEANKSSQNFLLNSFIVANALVIKQDKREFLGFLNKNINLFKKHQLLEILNSSFDAENLHGNRLYRLLNQNFLNYDHPYISGECYFIIGYIMMQKRYYDIALEYFKTSQEIFDKTSYESLKWRTKFNIYLVERKLKLKTSKEVLLSDYELLSSKAKLYFSRFIAWLYLEEKKVNKACEHLVTQVQSAKELNLQNAVEHLERFYIYCNLKSKGITYITSAKNIKDVLFKNTILKIQNANKGNLNDILASNSKNYGLMEQTYIVDIYAEYLYLKKKYTLLKHLYESATLKPEDNIIMYSDIRELILKSYIATGKNRLFENMLIEYKTNCSDIRSNIFLKELKSFKAEVTKKEIVLNANERTLVIGEKNISFKQKRVMFKAVSLLIHQNGKLTYQSFAEELYGNKVSSKTRNANLKSLFNRLENLLKNENIFLKKERYLKIDGDFRFTIINEKDRTHRLKAIAKYAKTKKNFTISDICQDFKKYSRRTLQEDLSILVERKSVERRGQARSSYYCYVFEA